MITDSHTPAAPPSQAADTQSLLRHAFSRHQGGDLAGACAAYEDVLRAEPRNFDALHMLGVARLQSDDAAAAAELIEQAVRLQPSTAPAWRNLASARRALGQVAGAADALQQCVELTGGDAATLAALGELNLEAGRMQLARAAFAGVLATQPQDLGARVGLGICERELGQTAQAVQHFQTVLASDPGHLRAANNLGIAWLGQGQNQQALQQFDRVLVMAPTHAPAHNARALALWNLKRLHDAEAAYGRAIELEADYAEALTHRAALRTARGHHAGAKTDLQRSLALQPERADTHNGMGVLLAAQRQYAAAIDCYHQALRLQPGLVQAAINLGVAEAALDHLPQAMEAYDRAVAARAQCAPRETAMAYANRSALWMRMRRQSEAAADAQASLSFDSQQPYQAGNVFYLKQTLCDWTGREAAAKQLTDDALQGGSLATPFVMLAVTDDPAVQLQAARSFAAGLVVDLVAEVDPALQPRTAKPVAPDAVGDGTAALRPDHLRRIRVAFVSADLHEHATSHLIAGLIESLDKKRFESVALSYGPLNGDRYQQRLQRAFDRFVDIRDQSDAQAASTMRSLGIDIAIDLKGYTHNGRIGIFSHRAAPVQVSYLGFPGTSGLPQMDYLLADATTVPDDLTPHFSEQIVRLPDSYQCNDAARAISSRAFSRSELGLPQTGFVFCCFNNSYKITPEVFDIWMRLLSNVECSVLWLLEDHPQAALNLRREAGARGVDAARLVFAPRLPVDEHLARQRHADLFLDTWPVNAHTTASDALWAGLPLVTMQGGAFAARVAASLLQAVGLPQCVTSDLAAYEALARSLASQPDRVAQLRADLASERETAPLFGTRRFARHFEQALQRMHDRRLAGFEPAGFDVADQGQQRGTAARTADPR